MLRRIAVVFLTVGILFVHGNRIVKEMSSTIAAWPCSRLFTLNGPVGCGSSSKDPIGGRIVKANNELDIDALEKDVPLSVIIPDFMLTATTLQKLEKYQVELLIVEDSVTSITGYSPDAKTVWNSAGTGLLDMVVPYPVSKLKSSVDTIAMLDQASENSQDYSRQHFAMMNFYQGNSTMDSNSCLSNKKCLPLGGLSVWGGMVPVSQEKETVLLTAGMDSKAFFHDLIHGANSAAAGIVTSLLAMRYLVDGVGHDEMESLQKQIIIALFQGESYNRIGSRRFVQDIGGNGCVKLSSKAGNLTCSDPQVYSLMWTKLHLTKISSVIALDQVISTNNTFGHGDSNLINYFHGITASSSSQLPPSPLASFTENSLWNGAGVVLSGYDTHYGESNPFYRSHYDVADNFPGDIPLHLSNLAVTVAKGLYTIAGGDAAKADLIQPDIAHATSLWLCFAQDFGCALVAKTLSLSVESLRTALSKETATSRENDSIRPPLLFTGVYSGFIVENNRASLVERFIQFYLSKKSVTDSPISQVSCDADFDCLIKGSECVHGNSSRICMNKLCVCSGIAFHDAVSPAVKQSGDRFVRTNYTLDNELWTEPFWETPSLLVYDSSISTGAVLLSAGAVLTILSYVAVYKNKDKLKNL